MDFRIKILILIIGLAHTNLAKSSPDLPSCDSRIYCQGKLLEVVQEADIFADSKSFVDQRMLFDQDVILENFEKFLETTNENPTKNDVLSFVKQNFAEGNELENWSLPDYHDDPSFLQKIHNESLRNFASKLVKIWPTLARKIKPEVFQNNDRYSIIPIPNGFVVPGGRFKETYYWDSYWIIKGLLISEMPESAKSMIDNFLYLVEHFGFVPNGARVYYLNRSQPPLLTGMARLLVDATNDLSWLKQHISLLEKELNFFLENRLIELQVDGKIYKMAHYATGSGSPRPESFNQDVQTCAPLMDTDRIKTCYASLKSAAESGWDFSYRWVFDENGGNNANRTFIQTERVVPVDLNSILASAFKNLAYFHEKLGNVEENNYWLLKFLEMREAIHKVLFNEDRGVWFDYDVKLGKPRQLFYPTNIAPLWAEIYDPASAQILGRRAAEYLLEEGIMEFYGGTPSSLNNTGEQWDYPSAWAPPQSFVIQGLRKSGDDKAQEFSRILAKRWIYANMVGFEETGEMFEKYDAEHPGKNGGGGEYIVQTGFGWTNGVALETIVDFFSC
ncbi:hypothetical protein WA026_010930 [Henosepilachna vigintioctopunctata]|uniref:Trehalase n=1 Tax=Henosepilachna vigintioctopunctata TaxID=420089 RepID=A0AAW1UWE2_9CUCU